MVVAIHDVWPELHHAVRICRCPLELLETRKRDGTHAVQLQGRRKVQEEKCASKLDDAKVIASRQVGLKLGEH